MRMIVILYFGLNILIFIMAFHIGEPKELDERKEALNGIAHCNGKKILLSDVQTNEHGITGKSDGKTYHFSWCNCYLEIDDVQYVKSN